MTQRTFDRILVTGASGFLGRHIVPELKKKLPSNIIEVSSKNYDLRHAEQAARMIKETKPDAIIHLAAKVGGIIANKKYPVDFFLPFLQFLAY